MITGLILIAAGVIVARSRATGTWYKTHRLLEILSGACIIAGLVIGVYMVALSGLPHLRNIHEVLGAAIGALLIITIAFGFSVKRARRSKNAIRTGHRWLGRITLALVVLNILLGILFLSIILRR
jgi:heme A synthase